MLKNLIINRQAIKKASEKKLVIYKAPIMRMFTSNLILEDDKIIAKIKKFKAKNSSLFYPTYGGFVNLEYECILPKEEEAKERIDNFIQSRESYIKGMLLSPNCTPERRLALIDYITKLTDCLYYDSSLMEPSHNISEDEFQKIKVRVKPKSPISY